MKKKIESSVYFGYLTKSVDEITLNDFDANGNQIQRVRKTSVGYVDIIPISAWSDIIPDSALSALDQRLIKLDAQTKCLEAYADIISENQVDNLKYDDNMETLQLMSGDKAVGDAISVRDMLDEGIPVVDLDGNSSEDTNDDEGCDCGCDCEDEDSVVEIGYASSGVKPPVKPEDEEERVKEPFTGY